MKGPKRKEKGTAKAGPRAPKGPKRPAKGPKGPERKSSPAKGRKEQERTAPPKRQGSPERKSPPSKGPKRPAKAGASTSKGSRKTTTRPRPAPARKTPKKTALPEPMSGPQRLQKIIAAAGVTSRRKAEELIEEGRVRVNDQVVTELGAKADPSKDRIEVDGRPVSGSARGERVYLVINKPKGVISALADPQQRPVVTGLLGRMKARVYPVGRLDYDAEGVLLLTNDGELSNRLIHPSHGVAKKYQVKVRGVPDARALERLAKGVFLEDGKTLPAKARLVRQTKTGDNSWIELTVFEGRNHLVKRMCAAVGHPVSKIKRVEFAGIRLGTLKPGQFRPLTERELERLRAL